MTRVCGPLRESSQHAAEITGRERECQMSGERPATIERDSKHLGLCASPEKAIFDEKRSIYFWSEEGESGGGGLG